MQAQHVEEVITDSLTATKDKDRLWTAEAWRQGVYVVVTANPPERLHLCRVVPVPSMKGALDIFKERFNKNDKKQKGSGI